MKLSPEERIELERLRKEGIWGGKKVGGQIAKSPPRPPSSLHTPPRKKPLPDPPPVPLPLPVIPNQKKGSQSREPEDGQLQELFRLYREGKIEPAPVAMGPLPPDADPAMREVAADLAIRFGLRLADGTVEPLPYATCEPIKAGIVATRGGASKVLHRLERAGVIWSPGSMPARGKPNGTRLFLPGPKPSDPEPLSEYERRRREALNDVQPGAYSLEEEGR
jgi:hypothetical protein